MNSYSGALCDSSLARCFYQIRIQTFFFCHRQNDCFLFFHQIVAHAGLFNLRFIFRQPRKHTDNAADTAQFFYLPHLLQHIVQIKRTFQHFSGHFFGFGFIHVFNGFFHQRNHVAMSQNTSGYAVSMKLFQFINFFARSQKLYRRTGNHFHRKSGTGAGRTVYTGQNQTGNTNFIVKFFGHIAGFLTD